jgi:CNT family concentrative nucleoside transporter
MERLISFGGLFVMMGIAWLMSSHRSRIRWRTIAMGLVLQFAFAFLTLRTELGRNLFARLGDVFTGLLEFVDAGAVFVFGMPGPEETNRQLLATFAFGVLPSIIFISSLMSILYHFHIMQHVVRAAAIVMQKGLRLSGAESLSVAANIFLGQVESPLVVRPYLATMTQSELMTIMMAGFATVAGGVLAAYVKMGIDAGHLVTASVIAAPASIVIAKIMQPEIEVPQTLAARSSKSRRAPSTCSRRQPTARSTGCGWRFRSLASSSRFCPCWPCSSSASTGCWRCSARAGRSKICWATCSRRSPGRWASSRPIAARRESCSACA